MNNNTLKQRKLINIDNLSISLFKLVILLVVVCFGFREYNVYKEDKNQTLTNVLAPKINDIYFLDFRLLSDNLGSKEKYKIAKIVDITGDIITLVYGRFFYQYQNAAINSIQYGQLSYKDYFEPKRYDLKLDTIKQMHGSGAIYLVKRPTRNKLYGSLVGPEGLTLPSSQFIYGKRENIKGEAFLKELHSETNFKSAFDLFQQSSSLGYADGQINLAEMYINGLYVEKDLNKAIFWLKQASLQSSKPAILKYGIVCKQIELCNIVDFYQELKANGVNIKVRNLDFKLTK
tara:strand:+ start:8586 stop:9452 length:867 start_codon:yes stop_codon:yes gene_type:complete